MRKIIILLLIPLAIAYSQMGRIEGRVFDEKGNPIPYANVVIVGTNIGSATNTSGEYSISVRPGTYVIRVSYIGYKTKTVTITVREGEILKQDFALVPDILRMEEVVVTGSYAPSEKKRLGNAISTVNVADIDLSGAISVDRALLGKISGALIQQNSGMPGGGVSIRLRGINTLLGSAEPLIVVDGIIVNNDSPYLVDTGYLQSRLLDLDPNIIDRIEVIKGAAAAALYGSRANNGVIQIFTKRGIIGTPRITLSTRFEISQLRKKLEVNMAPIDARGNSVQRYDWQPLIFRTAYGSENNLSVSGGTGETRYLSSISYYTGQGILRGTNFNRASLFAKLNQVVTNWLSFSVTANYINSRAKELPSNGGGMFTTYYYGPLSGFIFGPNTFDPRPDPTTGVYPNPPGRIAANPIEAIDRYKFYTYVNRFIGGLSVNLIPVSGLNVDYVFGFDTYTQTGTAYIPPGSTVPGLPNGFSRRGDLNVFQLNNDLTVRYSRSLTSWANSSTIIGFTSQYDNTSRIIVQSLNLPPLTEIVSSGTQQTTSEYRAERIIYGFFAQEGLEILNRLFITFGLRIDASSVFGKENRWQTYPKASLSYLISEENFWKRAVGNVISTFRLRAAFGESGGLTAIAPYDRFTNMIAVSYDGKSGLVTDPQMGNDKIKPERQRELEFGFDLSLFNERLALELTYYNKKTTDLLLFRSLATSTGYSTRLENVGILQNKGIELSFKFVPVDVQSFRWVNTLIYSSNRNKIDGIQGGILIIPNSWGLSAAINGQPLPVYYGRGFLRDQKGNIVYDQNGIPQADPNPKIIGNPNPDFTASFISELTVKGNLSIRVQLDAVYGNDVFNFARRIGAHPSYGVLKDYEKELRGEVPKGYGAAVFRIFENWIEDGSYIKLREISISYLLQLKNLPFRSVRVSLIGRNLLSFDRYSGYDPETNIAAQATAVRGYDYVEVPIPRSYSIQLTFNF